MHIDLPFNITVYLQTDTVTYGGCRGNGLHLCAIGATLHLFGLRTISLFVGTGLLSIEVGIYRDDDR